VLSRSIPDGVVLLPVGADEPFALSRSGALLWELLASPVGLEEASRALAHSHGVDPGTVAADISPLLEELARRRAVREVR
jgi:hypothetical protein